MNAPQNAKALPPFADRYRLYIDESGDHVFNNLDNHVRRYLCLLGCFFKNSEYSKFHDSFCAIKAKHFGPDIDDVVIFHREDMVNKRGIFEGLRDEKTRNLFNADLIAAISTANFKLVGVVIDKLALQKKYTSPVHPYHLAMGFLLQRFCAYLKWEQGIGDVLAESRGGVEDMKLKGAYRTIFETGIWDQHPSFFQSSLSSKDLKLKPKANNTNGLQLCDLLGHPVKHHILLRHNRAKHPLSEFDHRILTPLGSGKKYYVHMHNGRIMDSGHVLWPYK